MDVVHVALSVVVFDQQVASLKPVIMRLPWVGPASPHEVKLIEVLLGQSPLLSCERRIYLVKVAAQQIAK